VKTKKSATSVWETTRESNLLRNIESGRFYARFRIFGKRKWVNLGTDIFSTAKMRLADERVKSVRRS